MDKGALCIYGTSLIKALSPSLRAKPVRIRAFVEKASEALRRAKPVRNTSFC